MTIEIMTVASGIMGVAGIQSLAARVRNAREFVPGLIAMKANGTQRKIAGAETSIVRASQDHGARANPAATSLAAESTGRAKPIIQKIARKADTVVLDAVTTPDVN